jgi:glutamyl-Q tRNA(Asp) synthetase
MAGRLISPPLNPAPGLTRGLSIKRDARKAVGGPGSRPGRAPMFITRFAPSPTGPLHLGHAYSAILAHDMARAAGGRFLLRMEDTDLDRCRPEYDALIQEDLRWLGLTWDGPIHRQSEHIASYNARLEALEGTGLLYPCSCTRADIRAALAAPQEGVAFNVYPGTCRGRPWPPASPATPCA